MRTGIRPSEEQIIEYQDLKLHGKLQCIVYKIENSTLITESKHETGKFDFGKDLPNLLPKDEPRYVATEFHYETEENPPRKTNKLIFIFWCPLTAAAQKRFTYSSSMNSIASEFGAIQKQFQVDNLADVEYSVLKKQMK